MVAAHFGLPVLDTGAIYRSLALQARERGVGMQDESALVGLLAAFNLKFVPSATPGAVQQVWLDGVDVTAAIRQPEVSRDASLVSAWPGVRGALLTFQRELARNGCVAEGRDMGTVVFPDARHKFFLTASAAARARRRHLELGEAADLGEELPSIEEVERDLAARDERDALRKTAPLRCAEDATSIDSSDLSPQSTARAIIDLVEATIGS